MSIYSQLAEALSYFAPKIYKRRFFKKLVNLDVSNIQQRNVEPELLWISEVIKKDDVFLDVGSNVGAYLFLLEQKLQPENLYGFEPNRSLYRRLKRLFPNQKIFPIALADQNTYADFKVPIISGTAIKSRGTLQTHLKEEGEKSSRRQKVKVMRLDDWVPMEHFNRLDFIKIDVEGAEQKTLEGGKKTIQRFKPMLLVEIEQRHHENNIWELISTICSWGYTPHYVSRDTLELQILDQSKLKSQSTALLKNRTQYINNIIFVPEI